MTDYEFVLRGEIGDHFGVLFDGMRLERVDGTTVLTGPVRDQAQLHGLIERIQELGIELVSVNPAKGPQMSTTPDTIVLIHGFWVTPRSWEHWITPLRGSAASASSRPPTRASRSRSRRSTPTPRRSRR